MAQVSYSDLELAQQSQQFQLKIAGYSIRIKFLPAEQIWFKRLLMTDFVKLWESLLEPAEKPFKVRVEVDFSAMEATGDEEKQVKYYAGLKWDGRSRTILLKGLQNVWVLQAALRHIVLNLVKGSGFVFHGSAVRDKTGKVHIFSARSGGGKSTTAKELGLSGWQILSDDTVVLVKTKNGWRCHSSGMVEKQFLPTGFVSDDFHIYFVEKAKQLQKVKIRKDAALLEQVIKQVWMLDRSLDAQTYELVTDFARQAKIYKLQLPLKPNRLAEVINEN